MKNMAVEDGDVLQTTEGRVAYSPNCATENGSWELSTPMFYREDRYHCRKLDVD